MIIQYEFRGKRKDTKKWVYGFLDYNPVDCVFLIHEIGDIPPTWNEPGGDIHSEKFVVIPETIGRFIGLKDEKGNRIYGDDILIAVHSEQRKDDTGYEVYEVYDIVNEGRGGFKAFGKAMQDGYTKDNNILYQFMWCNPGSHGSRDHYYQLTNIEVVGNRIDNPDYLLNPLQRSSVTNTMNIEPKEQADQEVKEQPADAVAPEQATEENAEEVTEG